MQMNVVFSVPPEEMDSTLKLLQRGNATDITMALYADPSGIEWVSFSFGLSVDDSTDALLAFQVMLWAVGEDDVVFDEISKTAIKAISGERE